MMKTDQHPHIEKTAAFIYILRNPRDVLISNARYDGVASESAMRDYAFDFINNYGVIRWKKCHMGSWVDNIASWMLAANSFPALFIKYEDLKNNTVETMTRVVKLFDKEHDARKIEQAVEDCTLKKMSSIEQKDKASGVTGTIFFTGNPEINIINKGLMGQSLKFIGEDVEEFYVKKFGNIVGAFGYE